ncbi:MAG: hypothetical protein AB8H86_23025 [Polyangiales bacterium]
MSKWLGIVCVVACFGIGCGDDDTTPMTDAGPTPDVPVEMDSGPDETDAGPGDTDAGPAPTCDFDGTYGVEPVEGNPALCDAADIMSCELVTVDGTSTVTCTLNDPGSDPISGDCTYDADCVCTGSTTIMGIPLEIAGDFPNLTLSADAAGMTCNFTLSNL